MYMVYRPYTNDMHSMYKAHTNPYSIAIHMIDKSYTNHVHMICGSRKVYAHDVQNILT